MRVGDELQALGNKELYYCMFHENQTGFFLPSESLRSGILLVNLDIQKQIHVRTIF